MKWQTLFSLKIIKQKYFEMSSATAVIGAYKFATLKIPINAILRSYNTMVPATVRTVNIRTPSRLTIFVLKFEQVDFTTMCLKYWICGKQSRPRSDAAFCGVWSGSTLFAQASLTKSWFWIKNNTCIRLCFSVCCQIWNYIDIFSLSFH